MTVTTPKILGQSKPLVATILYTVPVNTQAQVTIFSANQSTNMDNLTIALIPSGQTLGAARYIAYRTPLIGNGILAMSSIGLNTGDQIYVFSNNGNISFTATGIEFN
jgi:hypothetical protein